MKKVKLQYKDATISITIMGAGKSIIFCNGLTSTQPHWKMVIGALQAFIYILK